mmetsp:Transcript_53820/g.169331  ORF Transcript_53820/g.169331 Transcript_53820/m.169331 type:complete len:472 (-) Transcript_53820:50-1465(-)
MLHELSPVVLCDPRLEDIVHGPLAQQSNEISRVLENLHRRRVECHLRQAGVRGRHGRRLRGKVRVGDVARHLHAVHALELRVLAYAEEVVVVILPLAHLEDVENLDPHAVVQSVPDLHVEDVRERLVRRAVFGHVLLKEPYVVLARQQALEWHAREGVARTLQQHRGQLRALAHDSEVLVQLHHGIPHRRQERDDGRSLSSGALCFDLSAYQGPRGGLHGVQDHIRVDEADELCDSEGAGVGHPGAVRFPDVVRDAGGQQVDAVPEDDEGHVQACQACEQPQGHHAAAQRRQGLLEDKEGRRGCGHGQHEHGVPDVEGPGLHEPRLDLRHGQEQEHRVHDHVEAVGQEARRARRNVQEDEDLDDHEAPGPHLVHHAGQLQAPLRDKAFDLGCVRVVVPLQLRRGPGRRKVRGDGGAEGVEAQRGGVREARFDGRLDELRHVGSQDGAPNDERDRVMGVLEHAPGAPLLKAE